MTAWQVQGMGRGKVPADWPPITAAEASAVVAQYPELPGPAVVTWMSPRPLSAAALVLAGDTEVFVKRHHCSVRSPAALGEEHAFADHLRRAGITVPRVLATGTGQTVVALGEWVYEVHQTAPGCDVYRDVQSWEPYRHPEHARAAGAALARVHVAAASFGGPRRAPSVLSSSDYLVRALDPLAALDALVDARPGLAAALDGWSWRGDAASFLADPLAGAAAALAGVASQWGHGDWHPSNLTWSGDDAGGRVVAVLDLGLANRTSVVHDVAVALERAVIGWLDLDTAGDAPVDVAAAEALISGYLRVRPLAPAERVALLALLPVVHVDFALSEVEYFATIVGSPVNAELAYRGYLLGHAQWFARSPTARSLLERIDVSSSQKGHRGLGTAP